MPKTAKVMDWLFEILSLHFYWIIYLFRGFIVAGVFPSTAAVFAICRHWMLKKEEESISKLFKRYYNDNFKVSNILGWLLMMISLIVIMNFLYIPYYPPKLQTTMYAIVVFMGIILFICSVYMFPTIVHYRLPVNKLFLVMFKAGFSSLLGIGIQVIAIGILILIVSRFPAFLLLFGITPLALVQMAVGINTFSRLHN